MPTRFGSYIRERRQQLGLSQDQLAERMGEPYRQADISRLEDGQDEPPRLGTLNRLALALEVQVGDLLIVSDWFASGHGASRPSVVQAAHPSL